MRKAPADSLRLCCLGLVLVTCISHSTGQDVNLLCKRRDSSFWNKTLAELQQVLSYQTIDLTFIMDISGSIDEQEFEDIRRFALELFHYAGSKCNMYIHPDYTRTEFILFDHEAQLTVANYSRQIHGCEFLDILEKLERPPRRGSTHIAKAMQKARDSFILSAKTRPVESQVLFIITDGQFFDPEFKIRLESLKLLHQGVKTFSVGVGYQVFTPEAEKFVQELASSDTNYACVEDWLYLLNPGRIKYSSESLWVVVTPQQEQECRGCQAHAQCACDVTKPKYDCTCSPGYYKQDIKCIECPSGTCKAGVGNDVSLCTPCDCVHGYYLEGGTYYCQECGGVTCLTADHSACVSCPPNAGLIAGLVVFFLLLLVLLLVYLLLVCLARRGRLPWLPNWFMCVCCPCCKQNAEPDVIRSRKALPALPTVAGDIDNPVYASQHPHRYEQPPPYTRDSSLYENLQHVRSHGLTDDLKGMENYISAACKAGSFTYLALYVPSSQALLCSPGLILQPCTMQDILAVLQTGKSGAEVTLMHVVMAVDRVVKDDHLHGKEVSVKRGARLHKGGPCVMWAVILGDYMLLGIGPISDDTNMENELFNLRGNFF